jgi:hypothetical protein
VYYSGGDRAERGVAIVVHKSIVKSVVKKSVYSDRIIAAKLKPEPVSMFIVQVYIPTSEYEDVAVEEWKSGRVTLANFKHHVLQNEHNGRNRRTCITTASQFALLLG